LVSLVSVLNDECVKLLKPCTTSLTSISTILDSSVPAEGSATELLARANSALHNELNPFFVVRFEVSVELTTLFSLIVTSFNSFTHESKLSASVSKVR